MVDDELVNTYNYLAIIALKKLDYMPYNHTVHDSVSVSVSDIKKLLLGIFIGEGAICAIYIFADNELIRAITPLVGSVQ